MSQQDFINAGFNVIGIEDSENKLLSFIKANYPSIIKDNEIDLNELKAIAGLPIDNKVNGYGLNFIGRNVARAKYVQKTTKALKLNTAMSKHLDTTKNLILKGDNLDSLKILKAHYTGEIKCIYIDPPYNTTSDEFVYPDKFDKEEAEVLGLVNLSEDDFARMDFSFKSKKSHNGWLSFMYPRLLLAQELLSDDGVIFISIDDNEQANLKLLCDDVFGEGNFVETFIIRTNPRGNQAKKHTASEHEYLLCYSKVKMKLALLGLPKNEDEFTKNDENGAYREIGLRKRGADSKREDAPNQYYPIYYQPQQNILSTTLIDDAIEILPKLSDGTDGRWRWAKSTVENNSEKLLARLVNRGDMKSYDVFEKDYFSNNKLSKIKSIFYEKDVNFEKATEELKSIFNSKVFDYPKPVYTIKQLITAISSYDAIILDFFAGSGTTGHAVMQLNAEDGGQRKFILCQIDEPIQQDKPAYQFCLDNNLPPVISSITIERLNRAGDKIASELEEDKQAHLDIGFKVFDSIDAPSLALDNGQISLLQPDDDAVSRIYNMIFSVGLDEPSQMPEEVLKDCIYRIGNHYYVTNSDNIPQDEFIKMLKNDGKIYIDGWTASLNGTLQTYKNEQVKIVF